MSKKQKNSESDQPSNGMLVFMAFSRMMDSGMGFIILSIVFLVALTWVFARQLESTDALKFLVYLASLKGLGGLALLLAIVMPPLFMRIHRASRAEDAREVRRLRDLVTKYEKLIPMEPELPLGSTSAKPKKP
jgi:hypothetical protein